MRPAAAIALGQPDALAEGVECGYPAGSGELHRLRGRHGNLKPTVPFDAARMPAGSDVHVQIGEVVQEAVVSDGTFAIKRGQLAFAPGSSGWSTAGGLEDSLDGIVPGERQRVGGPSLAGRGLPPEA